MTDQFSPEYIDYILSDEAKGLQEKWEPKAGDWCIQTDFSMVPALVLYPEEIEILPRNHTFWLPTLWDLLQIIEGALRRKPAAEWVANQNIMWEGRPDTEAYCVGAGEWVAYAKDFMLAAAKLAVQAVINRA